MKILHLSDLHARPAWFKWLVRESSQYDLVCIAGDLLDLGRDDVNGTPEEQIDMVLNHLSQLRVPYAVCSGNHDLMPVPDYDTARWAEPLRGPGVFLDRTNFEFRGYKFRCVPWRDHVPANGQDDFVWIIHAPPYGACTSTVPGGVSFGCEELRDVCLSGRGPRFVLSGHVHASLGFCGVLHHTISLNPGRGEHPIQPSRIVIDMSKRTVTHRRAMPSGIRKETFNFIS